MPFLALCLLVPIQDPAPPALPPELVGHWSGAVVREGALLPLAVELRGDGAPALLDLPSWGVFAQPAPASWAAPELTLPFRGARLSFVADAAGGALRGALVAGAQTREQSTLTIELTRVPAPEVPPIVVEEVRFASHDGVELAGTLALPAGPGPHPAIVFVQGRSYGSREQFRGHAILAARRGIAGLAFDGRGAGASGGTAGTFTLEDRYADAQAALERVRGDARVDGERVGLFGHSTGGWIVPVVAQRAPPVAFLVLHSGPTEPLAAQQGRVMGAVVEQRAGVELDEAQRASIFECWSSLCELSARGAPWAELEAVIATAREEPWAQHVRLPTGLDDANLDYFRRCPHDSGEALAATRTPLLALYGSEDFVVSVPLNVELLELRLRAAGNVDHRVVVFPGADHDLMIPEVEAEGSPYRWQRRPPGYFETLLDWVSARVGPR